MFIVNIGTMAFFCFLFEFIQARVIEQAIRKKRISRTTGKTLLGRIIKGFIDSYKGL